MSILDAIETEDKEVGRIYGVAAGVVTNNQDGKKNGRIKLKFPWLSDDNETDWVRIATFMSGNGFGGFFLPEVGDEASRCLRAWRYQPSICDRVALERYGKAP